MSKKEKVVIQPKVMRWLEWVPVVVGIGLMVLFAVRLFNSTYFSHHLARYGVPICYMDRHQFKDEYCSVCGTSIMEGGVFYSSKVAMDNPYGEDYKLSFSDYYSSYDEFKADYSTCLHNSIWVALWLLFDIGYSTHLIRERKQEKRGKLK